MRLTPLAVDGAFMVEWEPLIDDRGWFARTFCAEEFKAAGLDATVAQTSVSFNEHLHTLRGMHYQREPAGESKLVRCSRGRIYDVVVDLRPSSRSTMGWAAVTLDEDTQAGVFIPPGVAHGFLTLAPRTEVTYQMSVAYDATLSAGVRYDDPALSIEWPHAPAVVSARDRSFPLIET